MKRNLNVVAAICALLLTQVAAAGPEPTSAHVVVAGAVEVPGDWTVERIRKDLAAEVREVSFSVEGKPEVTKKARCVSLLALVQAAKPKIDPAIKGHRLAFVVAVRGRDGYTTTFSLGELLPEYGRRDVWVALDLDGAALEPELAPVEILVPADERRSRWVRGVASVTVIDTTQLAAAPGR